MANALAAAPTTEPLKIGRQNIIYGRNVIHSTGSSYSLQSRLFVNDPWELIAEAIARALPAGKVRDIAQSFRRQAEDYFRVATAGRELAVRPVLLYYAFLNLAKAYAVANGRTILTGRVTHGIRFNPRGRTTVGATIEFDLNVGRTSAFLELLRLLDGSLVAVSAPMRLGHLIPQVLAGHRLWCYAAGKPERFLSLERISIFHSPGPKNIRMTLDVPKDDFNRLNLTERKLIDYSGLHDFQSVALHPTFPSIRLQQTTSVPYVTVPEAALTALIASLKNRIWETVRVGSPYRKHYVYCTPPAEYSKRLPQIASIYLLMFALSSVTRYNPEYFDNLLDSRYGSFVATFLSESPMQFLYLMASEILKREVSKPAII